MWWYKLIYILAVQRTKYLNSRGKHSGYSTSEIWNYKNNYKRVARLKYRIENFWTEPL